MFYQRCYVKTTAYEQLLVKYNLTDVETAYVGDDVVDIALLKRVGLPIVVATAPMSEEILIMITTIGRQGGGQRSHGPAVEGRGQMGRVVIEYDNEAP